MENETNAPNAGLFAYLLSIKDYSDFINKEVSHITKNSRICYVCLNRPNEVVKYHLQKEVLSENEFFFIQPDGEMLEEENILFIKEDEILRNLSSAIKEAITAKGCNCIILDAVSSLFFQEEKADVLKFIYGLSSETWGSSLKKMMLLMKEECSGNEDSVKDILMFADHISHFNE